MSIKSEHSTLVSKCKCHPIGWVRVGSRTWKPCPIHYTGQLHPVTRDRLIDEVDRLAQAEMRSRLSWRIAKKIESITSLKELLSEELSELDRMQTELDKLSKLEILHEENIDLDSLYSGSSFRNSDASRYVKDDVKKDSRYICAR